MNKTRMNTTKLLVGLALAGSLSQASAQNWPQNEQAYQATAQNPQWIERAPQQTPRGNYSQAPYYGNQGYQNGYGTPTYYMPNPMPYYMPQMNMVQPPVMRQAPFNSYNNGNYTGPMNNFTRPINNFFNGQNGYYPQSYPGYQNNSWPNMNNMNMPSMPNMDFDMPNMNNMPFMGNGNNSPWSNMPFMGN